MTAGAPLLTVLTGASEGLRAPLHAILLALRVGARLTSGAITMSNGSDFHNPGSLMDAGDAQSFST